MAADNTQKTRIRCFIYTRVSTEEQLREGFDSLESQENSCMHHIQAQAAKGWEYVKTYSDTATGANVNRPGLQSLLQDMRDKKADQIVVYKIDRLSRSIADFYDLWREFEGLGVQLACSTQSIDTSDGTGRLMLNILLSFAQFEREINSQRVRDKRLQSLRAGYWQGGHVPFGYEQKESKELHRKVLVPHEEEAKAVRLIFDHFLKTESQSAVKDFVNSLGYRSKVRKKKDPKKPATGGKRFDSDDITRIINNRLYIGELYDEKTNTIFDGGHEAIISDKSIWVAVQKILQKKSKKNGEANKIKPTRDKYVFMLKGLVHCTDCKSMMSTSYSGKISEGKQPYLYYQCTEVTDFGRDSKCSIRSLPARPLEDLIVEATINLAKQPKLIEMVVKESRSIGKKDLGPMERELADYRKRNGEVETRITQLLDVATAKGVGALSNAAKKELEEIEQEKKVIESKICTLAGSIGDRKGRLLDADNIQRVYSQFAKILDKLTLEEKKAYCQYLIERIDIYSWDPTKKENPPETMSQEGLRNSTTVASHVCKLQNKWYRLKIKYRDLPDLPAFFKDGSGNDSVLGSHPLGSASRARTCDRSVTL